MSLKRKGSFQEPQGLDEFIGFLVQVHWHVMHRFDELICAHDRLCCAVFQVIT
jgi:hypothetical protein